MPVIRRCAKAATVDGERYHALEEPTSLNTTELLPELMAANIASVKIEGRQRSPAYVTRGESLAPRSIAARPIRRISYHSPPDGDPGRHVRGDTNYPWRLSP